MSKGKTHSFDVKNLSTYPKLPEGKDIAVQEEHIPVAVEGKTLNIFSRQTSPEGSVKLTVLLLHGQAFTSKNWEDIKTLQLLATWGYKAVAVDLPGYGNSKDMALGNTSSADFLSSLVKMTGDKPVIISPSMSGGFSLPYLFDNPSTSCQKATAYIPVAPVMTGSYRDKYASSELPTLIVYGSRDENLGIASLNDLKRLPNSSIAKIPDAGHACYINQPELFHNVLYTFLSSLQAGN